MTLEELKALSSPSVARLFPCKFYVQPLYCKFVNVVPVNAAAQAETGAVVLT